MAALKILSPIHKATRQIQMYLEPRSRAQGVSNAEAHLLTYLLSYAPCPLAELHRVFGLKRSTLTSILDRLEGRKLIQRQVHPDDRRSWMVSVLPEGRRIGQNLRKILEDFEAEVAAELSPDDLDSFKRVMDTVGRVTRIDLRAKA